MSFSISRENYGWRAIFYPVIHFQIAEGETLFFKNTYVVIYIILIVEIAFRN